MSSTHYILDTTGMICWLTTGACLGVILYELFCQSPIHDTLKEINRDLETIKKSMNAMIRDTKQINENMKQDTNNLK